MRCPRDLEFIKANGDAFKLWSDLRGCHYQFEAGVEQGTAEGVEKGVEQGIEKVAKSLLSLGIPVEQIVVATGLPLERIEALRQS